MIEEKRYGELEYLLDMPEAGAHPLLVYLHGIGEAHDQSERNRPSQPLRTVTIRSPLAEGNPALGQFVIAAPQMLKRGEWDPHLAELKGLIDHVRSQGAAHVSKVTVLAGFSVGATGVVKLAADEKISVSRWCAVDAAREPGDWWKGPADRIPHAIINGPYGLTGGPELPAQPAKAGDSFRVRLPREGRSDLKYHTDTAQAVFSGNFKPMDDADIYHWLKSG